MIYACRVANKARFVIWRYNAAMPIHDWTRVSAGTFHAFHNAWIAEVQRAMNGGLLPADYYALAEQVAGQVIPDVLTLQDLGGEGTGADIGRGGSSEDEGGGTSYAIATAPPRVAVRDTVTEAMLLAAR